MKQQLSEDARLQYEKERDKASKKMHENIPLIQEDELKNADINRRINSLMLVDDKGENLTFSLTLHDGQTCELLINELQIRVLVHAVIHAINNAGMRELALRITSLLDFLPLYDVDCQQNDNLEYDSYTHPEWKQSLFHHYLAIIYRYTDDQGKAQFCGSVVKTRAPSGSKEAEAITRRLLDFSPRLKKLAGVSCQVFVRTLTRCIIYALSLCITLKMPDVSALIRPTNLYRRPDKTFSVAIRHQQHLSIWALINLSSHFTGSRNKAGQHSL